MKRPMKAPTTSITDEELKYLPYPVYGSPKLDGFRCIIDRTPKTSSMKEMPNPFVQSELSYQELHGLDGELIVGEPNDPNAFNNSTGPLRRHYGEPDFYFYVFDNWVWGDQTYKERWIDAYIQDSIPHPRVIVLYQLPLQSPEHVIMYEQLCIDQGYEGAMIRTATGKYKQGRATYREMNIFKRKPFADTEGIIVGFTEQMTNLNPKEVNEMGLTKRATHKENLVGADTLGNFILKAEEWEKPFHCGGGKLNHAERKKIWDDKESYLGEVVTFKYQKHGSIDAPRTPIFLRFDNPL